MSLPYDPGAPTVLVTRPAEDAPPLASALTRAGYVPVVVPLLERQWDLPAVIAAAEARPHADWVLVTSGTVADLVAVAAPHAWAEAKWAAVGEATARRLQQLGFTVDLVPRRATAQDLADTLAAKVELAGLSIVYPRADLAGSEPIVGLRAAGADVVEVVAYRNVPPADHVARLRRALPVDATTLMSGSAAQRLARALPGRSRAGLGAVVCIGPSTARVARSAGLEVHAVAHPHSLAGLLAALGQALSRS